MIEDALLETCTYCGKDIYNWDIFYDLDHDPCCVECFGEHCFECEECHKIFDIAVMAVPDGGHYCPECLKKWEEKHA